MDVIAAPHAESSSDHRNQTIDMTLDRSCRTFWSSTGFPTEECSHFLTYKLDQDCMIAYVSVKPYRSAYQHQMPTYAPSFITIISRASATLYIPRIVFHLTIATQLFYLPHMVFGRYVTVFMEEAIQKQHGDNLHYVAIEHVACKGIPLKMLEHYPTITSLVRSVFAKEKQRPLAIDTEALREYMNDLDTTDRILSFLEEGRWKTAADMIIQSSEGSLARSNPMLEAFLAGLSKVTPYGNQDWVFQCLDYFFDQFVVHQVQLLHHEATCLAAVSVLRGEVETVYNCLREELIECTVELGNIFYQVIECYVKMNKFGAAAEWTLRSYDPDQITSLLRQLTVGHPRSVLHLFSMAMLR
ncbi:hypothetical protein EDD86DRAFT_246292 [Gorgonomyces haynaldii]|nr:hypothetical protein EDD86DRAFT_246292 [Gorgonomyces haynaldii]